MTIMKRKKAIGTLGGAAAAMVVGGLGTPTPVGATPLTLTGINSFSESNALTNSTYTNTNLTPGSISFPHVISREFTNSGAYEIVPFIRIDLSSVPVGSQVTGAQVGLFYTDSTYYGGAALRQEYIDLWAVNNEFDPATVNMTTYDGTNPWTDGFRAGVHHSLRTGPAGSFMGTIFPTTAAPAGAPSEKLNNNVQEYKIFSSDDLDSYLTMQANLGKDAYFELTNSNGSGNAYRFVATGDDNGNFFGAHYAADHQPFLSLDYSPLVHKWRQNDNGDWSTATNWFGRLVPGAVGNAVEFGSWNDVVGVVYPQGSIGVNVDTPRTVGHIIFDSPETYTIGGAELVLDVASGSATINVLNGTQVITAPVTLNKNTIVTVEASAPSLTISGDLTASAGVTLTKEGGGILTVNHLRLPNVSVNAGTVAVAVNGGAAGASRVETVAVTGTGELDLSNNDLMVSDMTPGTATGGTYDGVQGLVQAGRNGGTWDGLGIVTSQADAQTGLTSLGVSTGMEVRGIAAEATDVWNGQTVQGSDTLVMYTYAGDANLDGFISGDDYAAIDFASGVPGASGWYNGDFNYDGIISGDDYSVIDFNVVAQGAPLGGAGTAGGIAAVPEPASAALLGLAAAAIGLRSRRRRFH